MCTPDDRDPVCDCGKPVCNSSRELCALHQIRALVDDGSHDAAYAVAEDEGIAATYVDSVIEAAREWTARVERNRKLAVVTFRAIGAVA